MNAMPWSKNDELFFDELRAGYNWQYLPAIFFALHDLPVVMPDLSVRDGGIENAAPYRDTLDLRVCRHRIEVKSRREHFTSPESFPYATAFVDTVAKYDGRPADRRPLAYIFLSRPTGSMLCVYGKSPARWSKERRHDRVRDIDEDFYTCPRELLRPLDTLIEYIRRTP